MKRLAGIGLILTLAACGGQDMSGDAGNADVAAGADQAIEDCLELVANEQYAEALGVCHAAVRQAPESERAVAGLRQASEGVAQLDPGAAELDDDAEDRLDDAGAPEGAAGEYPGTTD